MLTRLKEYLLVQLMSEDLLDAIHNLWEEQTTQILAKSTVNSRHYPLTPLEKAVDEVGDLLDAAQASGWKSFQHQMDDCLGIEVNE